MSNPKLQHKHELINIMLQLYSLLWFKKLFNLRNTIKLKMITVLSIVIKETV